ncbi:MAG: hypothetical protein K2K39_01060, partial [Clostridia bacterium]|nr:hypothetical protein [Clostridia bacterium]
MLFNLLAADGVADVAEGAEAAAETAAGAAEKAGIDWSAVLNTVVDWMTHTGIKIVIALAVLLLSFAIINAVTKKI